jgi:hypothetical protein
MNHPNIVRVERLMEVSGRPVVVMEHVQGVSLDALLLRFKDGLPAAIAIEVVRQTFLALHVAYTEALGDDGRPMRVIHRDIKPSNILLSIHGEVKVVDFGIAKGEFDGREAHTESVVMGSRPYMAPERLDGVPDTPAVDVYSSGMSLFELLTGRHMNLSINPVNHDQAMTRHLSYVQAQGMSAAALDDLRSLVRRMCAYTREYRPNAVECGRDLELLLQGIEPRYRIGLEEFARTTVLPIYESRPRIMPEDALGVEDGDFLREVTGAMTETRAMSANIKVAPYLFVGGLVFVVALLAVIAGAVAVRNGAGGAASASANVVRVNTWFPSDAQAQVGPVFLMNSGAAKVPMGDTTMQVIFDDGRTYGCNFDATKDLSVRFIWDGGFGLSVNDGPVVLCTEVRAVPSSGGDGGVKPG